MKITGRQALKISRLIGKLDLKIKDPTADANEVGADLMLQIAGKLGDAEDEVAEIISIITGVPVEEALDVDLVEVFEKEQKEGANGFLSFFTSAVKSRMKE